jgi:hypothetical protein
MSIQYVLTPDGGDAQLTIERTFMSDGNDLATLTIVRSNYMTPDARVPIIVEVAELRRLMSAAGVTP